MSSVLIGSLICLLVIVVADAMELFKNKYGQQCEADIDCGVYEDNFHMSCEKKHCICPRGSHASTLQFSANYTQQLNILCKGHQSCFNNIKECTYGNCIADQCQCAPEEIRVEADKAETKCVINNERQLAQGCGVYVGMCSAQQHLYCINASCRCEENYIYYREKSTCVEMKDFLYIYNMLIYRGLFGFYCTEDAQCSSSFVCSQKNFSCVCPEGCSYMKWEETCVCKTQYASGPVVIGIVGSVAIFLFWSKKIFALCMKYRVRHAEVDVDTLERREHDEGTDCILPPSGNAPANPVDYSQPPPPYSANLSLIGTHMDAPPTYEEAMRNNGMNTAKMKENIIT
ncbi:uncharacterized protein LOC143040310 [Oratosquilla oratoria]|uniref:uncharacterized protein LOC143040310 n=1 Tax=Oratosquilla oratoria TaxID=337810 RepID=UPI003F7593E6